MEGIEFNYYPEFFFAKQGSNTMMLIQTQEPPVAPALDVWNKVQRWMGDVQFDDFVASESGAPTTQPLMDEEIINLVCIENEPHKRNLKMKKMKLHMQN